MHFIRTFVNCENRRLEPRVESIMRMAIAVIGPLAIQLEKDGNLPQVTESKTKSDKSFRCKSRSNRRL